MFSKTMVGLLLVAAVSACGESLGGPSPSLEGNYVATLFRVTPSGQAAIDILAGGGSLTIAITSGGQSSGSLFVPASLNGGTALSASMAGTAVRSGTGVTFTQSADTFVRDLTWTLAQSGLSVSSQVITGDSYSITLSRQ